MNVPRRRPGSGGAPPRPSGSGKGPCELGQAPIATDRRPAPDLPPRRASTDRRRLPLLPAPSAAPLPKSVRAHNAPRGEARALLPSFPPPPRHRPGTAGSRPALPGSAFSLSPLTSDTPAAHGCPPQRRACRVSWSGAPAGGGGLAEG